VVGPILALTVPCALVVLAVAGAVGVWRADLQAVGVRYARVEHRLLPDLVRWRERPRDGDALDVVLLGDSLTGCVGAGTVGGALEQTLAAGGVPSRVLQLVAPGLRPITEYYVLDDVLAGQPQVAVIDLNLRAFSDRFLAFEGSDGKRYRSLVRKLSLTRSLGIVDALQGENMSLLDPMIYRLEERLGLLYVPSGARMVGEDVMNRLGEAIGGRIGLRRSAAVDRLQPFYVLDAEQARAEYAVPQTEHSGTRILARIVHDLRAGGARVLVYVAAVDVERLQALGVYEELALPSRIEALRLAIGASPDEWLDLHALLPTTLFSDAENHMVTAGCERIGAALADRLNPRVL
jgi:hypothetical protein